MMSIGKRFNWASENNGCELVVPDTLTRVWFGRLLNNINRLHRTADTGIIIWRVLRNGYGLEV